MADKLARAKLAREASALNRAAKVSLPALAFLTDDMRTTDPAAAIDALPRGSLVILRAREQHRRAYLASLAVPLARRRNLVWLIADDPELAAKSGSHGAHFPDARIAEIGHWRARRPGWLITCSVHGFSACRRAARAGADAALLSPVFATRSHPDAESLGALRARHMARQAPIPLFALGGIDADTAARLRGARLAGLGAIGALMV